MAVGKNILVPMETYSQLKHCKNVRTQGCLTSAIPSKTEVIVSRWSDTL